MIVVIIIISIAVGTAVIKIQFTNQHQRPYPVVKIILLHFETDIETGAWCMCVVLWLNAYLFKAAKNAYKPECRINVYYEFGSNKDFTFIPIAILFNESHATMLKKKIDHFAKCCINGDASFNAAHYSLLATDRKHEKKENVNSSHWWMLNDDDDSHERTRSDCRDSLLFSC